MDTIAMRDTIALAAKQAREGGGPSLIECRVPRLWGHHNRDIEHYRSKADKLAAEALDPITLLSRQVIASGLMNVDDVSNLQAAQTEPVETMTEDVMSGPKPDVATALHHVVANTHVSSPRFWKRRNSLILKQ
jgi:2-oxoisovalerate dehydrogenase E1 component